VNINYKKIILTTGGFTLLALLVSCLIMFLLLFFVFTKDLADFCYYLGDYTMAGNLYSRVYDKNGEINYCYMALTIDIKTDDYDGVIKNYEMFIADDEYKSFMEKISYSNQIVQGGVLERSALTNEYNYLEDKYTLALIKTKNSTKAFERAVEMFSRYENFTFTFQGYYSLNRFINADNIAKFDDNYVGYDGILVDAMQDYFNDALIIFEQNKSVTEIDKKAFLVSLGNRLILVGQSVNTVYNQLDYNTSLIATNVASMTMINDTIKGLI